MTEKNLTCIICPLGCSLKVTEENGEIQVSGNSCPRGALYGKNEVTNPMRTVTSTMRTESGRLIPVKTDRPIPKGEIFSCMAKINETVAPLHVHAGDVIIENVFGANVVATGEEV